MSVGIERALAARARLAMASPRRPRVSWGLGLVLAAAFTAAVLPALAAERWLEAAGMGAVVAGRPATVTVRIPELRGFVHAGHRLGGSGVVLARGDVADARSARAVAAVRAATPGGALPDLVEGVLVLVLAGLVSFHLRRSQRGRLVRVQAASLGVLALFAIGMKLALLVTAVSPLAIPVALFALVPALVLDRTTGLTMGVLAALVVSLLAPFDLGIAAILLVQVGVAGLVVGERPRSRVLATAIAGLAATGLTIAAYALVARVTTGALPAIGTALHSPWLAAALGPALAAVLAVPLAPLYARLVGEVTHGQLVELEHLSQPLLQQLAKQAPGTWQHSLMVANLAESAANAIGASGRLCRVGAYYHDLGKSLQPKYFVENLEPGESSPHESLPPEASCDAIFASVVAGIEAGRAAGLPERIIDFMHMHHGDGVLEPFWAKCRDQGNPQGHALEAFRYPGPPPQSRETAILAICDVVEAASRTLKAPDVGAIDALVHRIVDGKLHQGQLDESGLSPGDLRRISDSLRETIRHANHGRVEQALLQARQPSRPDASLATGDALAPTANIKPPTIVDHDADVGSLATAPAGLPPSTPPPRPDAELVGAESSASREPGAPDAPDDRGGPDEPDLAGEVIDLVPAARTARATAASIETAPLRTVSRSPISDAELGVHSAGARKRAATLAPAPRSLDSASRRRAPTVQPSPALRRPGPIAPEADVVGASPFDADLESSVTAPRMMAAVQVGDREATRRQSVDEIEVLHRRAQQQAQVSDSPTRRIAAPTAEVDPDDIESAIELAPPVRRASTIGVAKPKRPL